jgi:hypothetical protein
VTYYEINLVIFKYCFVFRLVAEQQDWKELQVDVAFLIGRDLQNAKVMEMARGMLTCGNLDLLPEFRSNNDERNGTDLLRKMGSTPSYDQIVNKYRVERDVTRHAGAGKRLAVNDIVEIDGEEVDVEDIQIDHERSDMDTSVELQEIVNEFDEDCSLDPPAEVVSVPYNDVSFQEIPQTELIDFPHHEVPLEQTVQIDTPLLPLGLTDLIDVPLQEVPLEQTDLTDVLVQEIPLEQTELIDFPHHEVPLEQTVQIDIPLLPLGQTDLIDVPLQEVPLEHTDVPVQEVSLEQTDLMDVPVQEVPLYQTDLMDVPVQEVSPEQTDLIDVACVPLTKPRTPVNQQKPTFSLVPDYDLTPSPVSSCLDRGSSSLMLILSDSEPDSPEMSPMTSRMYQPIQANLVTPARTVPPRPALPSLFIAGPTTPFIPTTSLPGSPATPVRPLPRLTLSSLLTVRAVTPSSISSPAVPVTPVRAPPLVVLQKSALPSLIASRRGTLSTPSISSPTSSAPPSRGTPRLVVPTHSQDVTPFMSIAAPTPQDEIEYVPSLDTYFSPGRLFPISVQLKKNICSQCGICRPKNWCVHLRNAAKKAGLAVRDSPVYLKNLTQLRKNQRVDKSKSGRKQPRKFDLIQIHELYNKEESEDIQLKLAGSHALLPKSSVDDIIESVVTKAYETDYEPDTINSEMSPVNETPGLEATNQELPDNLDAHQSNANAEGEKLYCFCNDVASGQMIGCDNLECSMEWFHFTCVNIKRIPRGKWFCKDCTSENITKRKLDFEDLNKEPKKRKTTEKSKCPDCNSLLSKSYINRHLKKFCLGIK